MRARHAWPLLLLTAPAGAQDDPLFAAPLLAVGDQPFGLVAGDVDGDGHPDLVATNLEGDSVSALLGRGDLTFEAARTSAAGDGPDAPVLVDLEGDGRLDLLVTSLAGVLSLRGQGDGDFEAPIAHAVGSLPTWIATGDVDGDGAQDALAAVPTDNRFVLLRGDGAGGLLPFVPFGVYHSPLCVAAADLDLDGDLDAVTANNSFPSTLTVRLGDGAGSFGPKNTFQSDPNQQFGTQFVGAEDLTGDGYPELLAIVYGGPFPRVNSFLNLGGTFGPPVTEDSGPIYPVALLADLDGDGLRDLACASSSGNQGSVFVRLADGAGGLGDPLGSSTAAPVYALAAADFDADGAADIASAHSNLDRVSVLPGDGAGQFLGPPATSLGVTISGLTKRLALADADADGDLDALAFVAKGDFSTQADLLSVLPWQSGGFGAATLSTLDTIIQWMPVDAAVGDLDGDSDADVVAGFSGFFGGYLSFLRPALNDGTGAFATQPDLTVDETLFGMDLGDLDGDGDLDALAADNSGFPTLHVFLGDGSGAFAVQPVVFANDATGRLVLRDVNLDGRADCVRSLASAGFVEVRLATAAGGLGPPQFVTIGFIAASLEVGDLDEDGLPDLCVSSAESDGGEVSVLHGLGNGTFTGLFGIDVGAGSAAQTLGDLDADGHLDAVFNAQLQYFSVLRGDGTGVLHDAGRYTANVASDGLSVADLDLDGLPEVVGAGGGIVTQPVLVRSEHVPPDAWDDLGFALAGAAGPPQLSGVGTLVGGTPITLKISDAKPLGFAMLVLGAGPLFAPLKGGTLVPQVTVPVFAPLDHFGHFLGSDTWAAGLPSGTVMYFQAWIPDAGGPKGYTATNGLRATSP
jgi:hypothetical protein